jgi:hypothetical protein
MASSTRADSGAVCDRARRLRDVSRLILDAIERDDVGAMERHVHESERLIAEVGAGLAASTSDAARESRAMLDHIRSMNAGMVGRLRERQRELLAEIARARGVWHHVRTHTDGGSDGSLDRES